MPRDFSSLLYWLYKRESGLRNKISLLERLNSRYDITLRMMVVNSEREDFIESLNQRNPSEYTYEETFSNQRVSSFNFERVVSSSENTYSGNFLVFSSEFQGTYLVVTHENRKTFRRGVKRFLEQYYPILSRPFISSSQLREFWSKVEDEETEIRTVKLVAYENKISTSDEERQEANVKYTDESYQESFRKVISDNMYIDKWNVESSGRRDKSFEGFISRKGILKCSSNFSNFYSEIVTEVEEYSSKQNESLKGRDRSHGSESQPLKIEYDRNVFEDVSMNKKLIDSLAGAKGVSCSVHHGNPYLYMSVTDFLDGSSFDIVVHSDNSIEIIPQMRGSPASISRMVNQIFEEFGEGKLEEVIDGE